MLPESEALFTARVRKTASPRAASASDSRGKLGDMLNSALRHVKSGHYAAPVAHRRNNGAVANNNNKEVDRFLTTRGGRAINRASGCL